jgi:hypothetical protein
MIPPGCELAVEAYARASGLSSAGRPRLTHFSTGILPGVLVPEERLELSWCRHRRILSPLRLPVPPFRPSWARQAEIIIRAVRVSEFDYELPPELIAQHPAAERTASRLLHLDAASGAIRDLAFGDFPGLVDRRDVLVVNDTRVVKARLAGRKASGGRIELFVERLLGTRDALVLIRASHPPPTGS